MRYRSNKIKIILTLIILVLFVIPINAKAESDKTVLLKSDNVFSKMISLAGNANNILKFKHSESAPTGVMESNNIISTSDSKYPVYIWYDSQDKTIYWWTEDNHPYFNEDSSRLFGGLTHVTEIDIVNFDTSKVKNMNGMFQNCSSLTELDLSNFDTSNVTDMSLMFYECQSLTKLDLSHFDTSKVTTMRYMFNDCRSLTELDLSNFNTNNVTEMNNMFSGCQTLTELDISHFNTSSVTSMHHMFNDCRSLTELVLSHFDTSNVTEMYNMFSGCQTLTELDLSHFDTSNVTEMNNMFANCQSLTELDLSHFDTSNVTTMNSMFANCRSLLQLDVSSFKIYNVKGRGLVSMFENCQSLTELDLHNFDISKATEINYMFSNCRSLVLLDLSNFNTENITSVQYIFLDCINLETIYIGQMFDMSKVTSGGNMFLGDIKLVGEKGTAYDVLHNDETYARIDDPDNGNPGYFTYKEYKPKIYYPDGTFEEVELGYLFTFPNTYEKDNENLATLTFNYHDGLTPNITSNIIKQFTFNKWEVNKKNYESGDTLTIMFDTYLEAEYVETIIPAEFPEDPALDNNTFLGWFDDPYNGTQYTTYDILEDKTFYAHWDSSIKDDNLNIENISVTGGSLDPSFDNDKEFYSLKLNNDFNDNDSLIINVQPESVFTTVVGNGQIDISQNSFTVTLTSEAGNTRVVSFDLIQNIRLEKYDYALNEEEKNEIIVTSGHNLSDLNVSVEDVDIADINNFIITAKEKGTTTARISLKNDDSIYRNININVDTNKLKSFVYEITSDENKQIIGVSPKTKVIDFKNNFENENELLFVYDNDTLLTDNKLVKTGSTVKLVINDEEKDMATIIVKGDINKDGKVNIEDESLLFDDAKVGKKLTDYEKIAADLDNTDLVDETDLTKMHDYILYRNEKLNLRKLTIDPNGGKYEENSEIRTITQDGDTIMISNPVKEGWTFNGWKLYGAGSIKDGTYTFGDGNGKLKAKYTEPKNIGLTLVSGGGSYSINDTSLKFNVGGSAISANIILKPGDKIKYSYVTGSVSLPFKLKYTDSDEYILNESLAANSSGENIFTYDGETEQEFIFNTSGPSGTLDIRFITSSGYEYTLVSDSISVNYNSNGGTITSDGCNGSYCSLRRIGYPYGTLPTPAKTGYTFNGWYLNSDFSGDKVTESTIVTKTEAHTLYAKYTINSYTLTINANGGTYSGTNPITQNYNTTATISKPTRSNYLFNGWSKSGAGSITNNETANQTFTFGAGNATITANWMSNKKTVSGSNLNVCNISASTVSSSACTSNPNVQLTLLPGESVTYYVVGSSGSTGGGGGSFNVDGTAQCTTSSSNSCSGTWKNTTSSNQTIKIAIGCSNSTASFSLSNVKTRYGETYTLSE